MSYYDRYMKGEYQKVWTELLEFGPQIREEPLYSEAKAVVEETMRRARENIEILIERLQLINYQFIGVPFTPAENTDAPELVSILESQAGYLPLSIRKWFNIVGFVNFTGHHPKLNPYFEHDDDGEILADPLEINAGLALSKKEPLEYKNLEQDLTKKNLFMMDLGSDPYTKSGYGGGEPYQILYPNGSIDCLLIPLEIYFIEYLRESFQWGGFPGHKDDPKNVKEEIAFLTKNLMPI